MAYSPTTWVNDTAPAINATNLNNIEDGIVAAGRPDTEQLWTKPQRGSWVDANDGVIVLAEAQNFSVVPTGNVTINVPSDLSGAGGQTGIFIIDASTFTISWGTGWYFAGGTAPTFTGIVWFSYAVNSAGTAIGCSNHIDDIGQV